MTAPPPATRCVRGGVEEGGGQRGVASPDTVTITWLLASLYCEAALGLDAR